MRNEEWRVQPKTCYKETLAFCFAEKNYSCWAAHFYPCFTCLQNRSSKTKPLKQKGSRSFIVVTGKYLICENVHKNAAAIINKMDPFYSPPKSNSSLKQEVCVGGGGSGEWGGRVLVVRFTDLLWSFIRVVSHQGISLAGLSSEWSFLMGDISSEWSFLRGGLSSEWSFLRGGLSSEWFFLRGGLSSEWSFIRGGLSSEWSLIRGVSHLTGLSTEWSKIKVVLLQEFRQTLVSQKT